MTLESVAKIAGVSPSTVSRVINCRPNVLPSTAKVVNDAMQQLNFKPSPRGRRHTNGHTNDSTAAASFLFIVLGRHEVDRSPGFESLLRGVSSASQDLHLDLNIVFLSDVGQLNLNQMAKRPDGLILHGGSLAPASEAALKHMPAVWLMANQERPGFGDQILPDNSAIGEVASSHLTNQGHSHLAICSLDWHSWSMEVRAHSFVRTAERSGATAVVLDARQGLVERDSQSDSNQKRQPLNGQHTRSTAAELVDHLLSLEPRPTGLFIAEDRQVMPIVLELRQRGVAVGGAGDLAIISCNNERPYLTGLNPAPPTIDIRTETIGYRGVEMLLSRIRGNGPDERIRTLVDPILIDPTGSPA